MPSASLLPTVRIGDALTMYYELDDYTDPWTTPETILLIHGVADTSRSWFAWVPQLARRFRVLRPDLRGFGQSSLPPPDHQWSLAGLAKEGKAAQSVMAGIFRYVGTMDITAILPQIKAPTLIITSDRGALASVETVREWQQQIPNSRLLVLPSSAYHLAAAHPEECAAATRKFIEACA
jgi:pimeloyl-ACP methyl ester carboxylesterase